MKPTHFPAIPVVLLPILLIQPTLAIEVTFQVNLSIQESLERFVPSEDIIEVRGSFTGWGGGTELEQDANNPSIYSLPLEVEDGEGAFVDYKFVIVDSSNVVIWESEVGDGQDNRAFEQQAADHVLPPVFFDNLSVDPGAGTDVMFQVDMAARIHDDLFDPEVDYVSVRGPFNNWEGNEPLVRIEEGSTIYQGTATVGFILPGSEVPYKFIINSAEWENGDNREFELAENAQMVPVRFFDDIEPIILLPLGILRISPVIDGSFTLMWDSAEAILQGSTDFEEGWSEVTDAAGQTELTLSTDLAPMLFFRLAQP
ncbi:hypothetical protein N9260_01000 [bacterium]|nr:hypothetical protein [bacterium]